MATMPILPEPDWTAIEARALDLFTTERNLEWDDALLAALLMERAPALARRALNLIETDGTIRFSLAFKIVRMTDREYGDAAPVPGKEVRRAA